MTVRRAVLGGVVIFLLGIGSGATLIRFYATRSDNPTEAQRRALHLLDQAPIAMNIGDNRIVEAVKRIAPSVVNIDTVGKVHPEEGAGGPLAAGMEVRGKGSGVILTPDGYIVTNNHVIDGANRTRVTLPDGSWYYAHLVGRDSRTDLAVVKIDAHNLPVAHMADSDHVQVGEWSIAVGNPLGLGSTVTVGVISALNRSNLQLDEGRNLDGAIQTDAPINRGNSGGALANINGQLIGLNTAILSSGPNGGSIGLGFALPANTVRRVARELIATGKTTFRAPRQAWIGVGLEPVPLERAQELGLPPDTGAIVNRIIPETPAALAGLLEGDIVLSVDRKPIGDVRDVREAITEHKNGDTAFLKILRANETHPRELRLKVQERPDLLSLH